MHEVNGVEPHLTPALSPPSDGAERVNRRPVAWQNCDYQGFAIVMP